MRLYGRIALILTLVLCLTFILMACDTATEKNDGDVTLPGTEEATTPGVAETTTGDAETTTGKKEESTTTGKQEEATTTTGKQEESTTTGKQEGATTAGKDESTTLGVEDVEPSTDYGPIHRP